MKSVLVVLALILLANTRARVIIEKLRNNDLIEGNCTNPRSDDRVFYDHVYKNAIPLVVRTETEEYEGSKTIYCIQALNQKSTETGGDAYIKSGGVGQTAVTIKLESYRGHGIEFYVSIYAS